MKKKPNNKRHDFITNQLNKYSIRKFTVGTSSILIGSLLFAANPSDAQAEEIQTTTEAPTTKSEGLAPSIVYHQLQVI